MFQWRLYPPASSAFSASAYADEDWTQISDLTLRRRIQNRIAQRKYRMKIKKRMQFLESKQASDESGSTKNQASQKHRGCRSSPNDNSFYASHPAMTTWMNTTPIMATAAPTLPPEMHFLEACTTESTRNQSISFASYSNSPEPPATVLPYDPTLHDCSMMQYECRYQSAPPPFSTLSSHGSGDIQSASISSSSSHSSYPGSASSRA